MNLQLELIFHKGVQPLSSPWWSQFLFYSQKRDQITNPMSIVSKPDSGQGK